METNNEIKKIALTLATIESLISTELTHAQSAQVGAYLGAIKQINEAGLQNLALLHVTPAVALSKTGKITDETANTLRAIADSLQQAIEAANEFQDEENASNELKEILKSNNINS